MDETIHKRDAALLAQANLRDYAEVYESFSWEEARAELDGLPGGGLNIAYEAVDRHLAQGDGDRTALRWLGKDGSRQELTYRQMALATNRFANVLTSLGVRRGDAVFGLMGRRPELYQAALGILKNGSVFSPLFSAFGPEPIVSRMTIGGADVLVTTAALYKRKVAGVLDQLPGLKHVLVVDENGAPPEGTLDLAGTVGYYGLMAQMLNAFDVPARQAFVVELVGRAFAGELAQATQRDLDVARTEFQRIVEIAVRALVPDFYGAAVA